MKPHQVTQKDLADFLLTLPDEEEINMASDSNHGCGCLMTKYGRAQGWEFDRANTSYRSEWVNLSARNNPVVAEMDGYVFHLFEREPRQVSTVKGWKEMLKPQFKSNMEPITVTLKELRDFILTLPRETPINMSSGYNIPDCVGCLMTLYGRSKGWTFENATIGWEDDTSSKWMDGKNVVAQMDGNPFSIFKSSTGMETNTVGDWVDIIKPLTKAEIIDETAAAYNSKTRAMHNFGCVYKTPDNKRCAVGRCILEEEIDNFLPQTLNSYQCSTTVTSIFKEDSGFGLGSDIDKYLKPQYRGHELGFWRELQAFHDDQLCWNENGLTELGKITRDRLHKTWKDKQHED